MRIWLTKNAEVPVRQQLVEQITLGVASGDLEHGERLPSTRDLARRFKVHPNTVSAAYRELAVRGVVEFRKGSGVFVNNGSRPVASENTIDTLIKNFLNEASVLGFSLGDIHDRIASMISSGSSRAICVIESDRALRAILVDEIGIALDCEVFGIEPDDIVSVSAHENHLFAALFDEREKLKALLPEGNDCVFLNANSIPNSLRRRERPSDDEMIAIVSGWPTFISLARLFLIAAKIDPNAIVVRSSDDPDWQHGLSAASIVICDAHTAKSIGDHRQVEVFNLIGEESIKELRQILKISL